ncbi:homocysteine S-methyltransferase family protein [Aspergillus undulatus]|uniref:homocysteine S-methyltransferase family protein n=1 Tax=Aspergillus undulatus TaxID=1810928 RepID=UPI003CCDF1A6
MQILLLDGGLGTTLESPPFNITFTAETPLWSSHLLISSPSTLQSAHRAFFNAGADIILTATYQSSIEGFLLTDASHTTKDAEQYMRSAVPLSRSVISAACPAGERQSQTRPPCRVALSLGPYGATMTPVAAEYTGIYPEAMDREVALREWHSARLRVFIHNCESESRSWDQVDYVAFETVRRADEVCAVRGAMRDVLHGEQKKPWWICGVFPAEEVDEIDVRRWVDAAIGQTHSGLPRPWGIGLNCTRIDHVARIVEIMRDQLQFLARENGFLDEWDSPSGRPWLVLYPDGTKGEKYDPAIKTWVKSRPEGVQRPWDESFWDVVQSQSEGDWEGIIVGGCCRVEPADIAALRRKIDKADSA